MNTDLPWFFCRFSWLGLALLAIFGSQFEAHGVALDNNATRQIWKLKYGVSDGQLADSNWLNEDSDGDGQKNESEISAGTNPFDSKKAVRVTSIARVGGIVNLQVPTESGKKYQIESTSNLADGSSWVIEGAGTVSLGDGTSKTLSVTSGASFFRVRVSDEDTDLDGLADWAERVVLLNPSNAQTTPGINDLAYVLEQLALPNVVSIKASTPFASEDGPTAGKITLTRTQNLFAQSINLAISGTALPGIDYLSLPASAEFTGHNNSVDLFVNPKVLAAFKGGRSVTATLLAPTSSEFPFTLGASTSATVIINGSTAVSGTGLLARYYDTASSNYTDAANFGQAGTYVLTRNPVTTTGSIVISYSTSNLSALQVGHLVKLTFSSGNLNDALYNHQIYTVTATTPASFTVGITAAAALPSSASGNCNLNVQSFLHPAVLQRVDTVVNNDWQYGTPNGATILPNNSPDNYSSAWETYLQPTTEGTYTFQLDADDKARVLLDTGGGLVQILEHGWTTAATVGTFKQSAGIVLAVPFSPDQRYRLRVEHVETTGVARCRLQWKLGSGSYANIPQANQWTHTQAMTYASGTNVLTVTPTGGHTLTVGKVVPLWFSTGTLFSPTTFNGNYTVATINGTTSFTVNLTGVPTTSGNGFMGNIASVTNGVLNFCYANTTFTNPPGRIGVDAAVTTGNNGIWGAGTPDVNLIQPDSFSVRWSGQLQPQFSEEYTLTIAADDGCRLLINGQPQALRLASGSNLSGTYNYTSATGLLVVTYTNLPAGSFVVGETVRLDPTGGSLTNLVYADYLVTAVSGNTFTVNAGPALGANATAQTCNFEGLNKPINDWLSTGTERYVRIPLVGGVRYDLQLEYYESNSAARCALSWYSASQPKQIIPSERLYPASLPQAPASQVSPTEATALVGGPFSYQIGANNGATVSVSGNPAWLIYSNGILSGTPPLGSGGDYQILLTLTNAAGTSTALVNLHVEANPGNVGREYWSGVSGTKLSDIPTSTTASGITTLTSLQSPSNFGDNYGTRLRGYVTAPATGNYYFWISGSNAAELWISNNSEPINAFKRAWVDGGSAVPLTWNTQISQKSAWLALEQGKKYYFEVLHKAGVGTGDHVAVGWLKPGENGVVPSEVVPGYVLSPYVPPAAGSIPGTLYVATLLSQNGAVTSGVGSSTLRLNADGTSATMRYTFSGLTGPITSQHIHVDPYLAHPAAIVYDIDTPSVPGDGLQPDGSYQWTITAIAGLTPADIVEIIRQGKAYINLHTAAYPTGEIRGNYTLANGSRSFNAPPDPLPWTDDHATDIGAIRFLTQTTFGANLADLQALKSMASYEAWIDAQFSLPVTTQLPEVLNREVADVFARYDEQLTFNTWWKNAVSAPDQLRQRVAFALSEIQVVSAQGPLEDNARALSHFYDTLLVNSFGNFRTLLAGTTLTPGMGRYLDMLRNDKPDLSIGRIPNENYAREIQQLFSIGLYRMWPDGNLMLDSQELPVDTYSQREIVGFAHVFTGWDYGYDGAFRTSLGADADWTRAMREVPARHFTGPKRILNNEVLPGLAKVGGQPLDPFATHNSTHFGDPAYQALPGQELAAAHDQLFNHANVGPFICRQLIQRLVTSHPSRDYLYRVVQKFNDNGAGVRGDMKAVIKAILLDYEARSSSMVGIPAFGKQREPVLRVTAAARAFLPKNLTGTYSQDGTQLITITTSAPHLLVAGNSTFLEFTNTTGDLTKPAPSSGTYSVVTVPSATSYTINAPGWLVGTFNQVAGDTKINVTMTGHWLPLAGKAYLDFLSATTGTLPLDGVYSAFSSTSVDFPGGSGNNSGTTFTIDAPDTTARTGNLMMARLAGTYSAAGGSITINTYNGSNSGSFGAAADHNLAAGNSVFLNFTTTRDTTSGTPSTTANDLVYPLFSVPDKNSFTVESSAPMNSDNGVYVFPQIAQPRVRSGTIAVRPGTFNLNNTDSDLAQSPLNSTTVFNFFLPDYKFPGALASQGITTPEFQTTAETTVVRQANFIYNGLFNPSTTTGISSFKTGTNALVLDFSAWMSSATDLGLGAGPQPTLDWTSNANLGALIDRLNTLLLAGQMTPPGKTVIQNFLYRTMTNIGTGSTSCPITAPAHGLTSGDSVTINGVIGGTFGRTGAPNFAYTVTVTDPDTFTIPVSCSVAPAASGLTNAHYSPIAYNNSSPTATEKRDRLRAVLHFLLTSPDYTIQR